MYRNCMFCHQPLGENRVVEHFPVGRRLAFDSQRGRLWVVCRKCERWNLTPVEERWEAVEDCERLFEVLKTRVSTENIGLGRHPGGVDLVRIGRPMRPEFAAWRYGDQFGRRRRKYFLYGAAGVVVVGGVVISGVAAGIISGALLGQSGNFVNIWVNGRTLAKLPTDDGKVVKLKKPDLDKLRLVQPAQEGDFWGLEFKKGKTMHQFQGERAREVASLLVPRINRSGAAPYEVQDAVKRIEESGHPEAFLEDLKRVAEEPGSKKKAAWNARTIEQSAGLVHKLPTPTRLALEMALHEEHERRALEGELAGLKAAWRQAEEIAEIADNLLLPEGAEEFLETHRADEEEVGRSEPSIPPTLQS
jgi:hypothetical protein